MNPASVSPYRQLAQELVFSRIPVPRRLFSPVTADYRTAIGLENVLTNPAYRGYGNFKAEYSSAAQTRIPRIIFTHVSVKCRKYTPCWGIARKRAISGAMGIGFPSTSIPCSRLSGSIKVGVFLKAARTSVACAFLTIPGKGRQTFLPRMKLMMFSPPGGLVDCPRRVLLDPASTVKPVAFCRILAKSTLTPTKKMKQCK